MFDWEALYRDFEQQPIISPVLGLYYKFMNIKRYDHMPFYFYPAAQKWISFEDTIIAFLDYLVDAHE